MDRIENPKKTLGKLGSIKVGEKVATPTGGERPTSLDYFRFDTEHVDWHRAFVDKFGEKPTELPIFFYEDGLESLSHHFELRDNQGKMIAIGNGTKYKIATDKGWEEVEGAAIAEKVKPLVGRYTTDRYKPVWREMCRIRFMIKEIPLIGYFEFKTMGKETTIPKIIGPYDLVKQMNGTVVGVPFTLCVKKHTGNTTGQAKSYPIVELICNLINEENNAFLQEGTMVKSQAHLPAPGDTLS
jgi:hypothetical protein